MEASSPWVQRNRPVAAGCSTASSRLGDTPIVRLPQIAAGPGRAGDHLAKLEYFNPAASVKTASAPR